jgi:hypothetical protein
MTRLLLTLLNVAFALLVGVVAYFVGAEEEAVLRAFTLGFVTLFLGGASTYLFIYFKRMRELELPNEELGDEEVVWAKTTHIVHYRTGNIHKFWETVGGKLFLTNHAVEFRANSAEFWVYRIVIPLREVHQAMPCNIGVFPAGLRIERKDGTFELFTFGAMYDVSREWADAIMAFRADLLLAEFAED